MSFASKTDYKRSIHFIYFDCSIVLVYGNVYAVVKNGGPDDGQWYALKTIEITNALKFDESSEKDSLKAEREVIDIQFHFGLMSISMCSTFNFPFSW